MEYIKYKLIFKHSVMSAGPDWIITIILKVSKYIKLNTSVFTLG